jgi:hypothetical protein
MTASQFIATLSEDTRAREGLIVQAMLDGHVPCYMRDTVPVTVNFTAADKTSHVITFNVLPNVLLVGTDDDRLHVPLWPISAQKLCDAWDCMLPTTKIVDLIWNAAVNKLPPMPWGPPYDSTMSSNARVIAHNGKIEAQMSSLGIADKSALTAGHKKDVVMTPKLAQRPKQVAIYGWIQPNGKAIQPLSLVHENTYCDYSHGERMVSMACTVDGVDTTLDVVLADPNLCVAVSNEGPSTVFKQP